MKAISLEEVGEAANEMKSGKATRLDGFPVEYLKKGDTDTALLEWLVRLLNVSFDEYCTYGLAWCMQSAHVQSEGDKCECIDSRGICLLSIVGNLCGRLLPGVSFKKKSTIANQF